MASGTRHARKTLSGNWNRYTSWCLIGSCCFLGLHFFSQTLHHHRVNESSTDRAYQNKSPNHDLALFDAGELAFYLKKAPKIADHSLTVILPVTPDSIPMLPQILLPFLEPSVRVSEVLLICPASLVSQVRGVLRTIVMSDLNHPDLSLRPWASGLDQNSGVLHAVSQVSTEYALLMDRHGLYHENNRTQDVLLDPPAVSFPVGPRGVSISHDKISCIATSGTFQKASYLLPPFVMPVFLATAEVKIARVDVWAKMGQHVSESLSDSIGGIVIDSGQTTLDWCPFPRGVSSPDAINPFPWQPLNEGIVDACRADQSISGGSSIPGVFAVFLPTIDDFRLFVPLACKLQDTGHPIRIFIYEEPGGLNDVDGWEDRADISAQCVLPCRILSPRPSLPGHRNEYLLALKWLDTFSRGPEIMITLKEEDMLTGILSMVHKQGLPQNAVLVRIPRADLPYCGWMSSLSLSEWKEWHTPRIDVSIITKDRPRSLVRLLSSLSAARFFGDIVDLRVHLEQSSDIETMQVINKMEWSRGNLFVNHRIIHGGLLPAVVESWYPHSNHTYGLILEDDIELSPLFYAWAKMSLLRYRYGDASNRSPQMFGISLYQQKNVELPPNGRQTFNARSLFSRSGLPDPSTPYLSPVPCSWGAIYFPEHWREFHDYLSVRLSEISMKIDQIIVPGVRSNKWTKSWKKYFIELVYLRGYVMLYPNFPDFISLSTNHIEVGSHVKARTKEKQNSFLLPLMQLPIVPAPTISGLLELPNNTLPSWKSLPVLNLTGSLTSLETLLEIGLSRRATLTGCVGDSRWYDAQDLMCTAKIVPL